MASDNIPDKVPERVPAASVQDLDLDLAQADHAKVSPQKDLALEKASVIAKIEAKYQAPRNSIEPRQ